MTHIFLHSKVPRQLPKTTANLSFKFLEDNIFDVAGPFTLSGQKTFFYLNNSQATVAEVDLN